MMLGDCLAKPVQFWSLVLFVQTSFSLLPFTNPCMLDTVDSCSSIGLVCVSAATVIVTVSIAVSVFFSSVKFSSGLFCTGTSPFTSSIRGRGDLGSSNRCARASFACSSCCCRSAIWA
ncbi:hypothetical protein WR25_14796 [Diploscapter pachys]|uniref:Uncharacterized protein n=1 Tax=Diploscapter pachys TaxID=2018661 RepID=A0A2A2JGQ0_9BILA|nr:hypothetical protein WR25_14796 [Diploscapter pachys]